RPQHQALDHAQRRGPFPARPPGAGHPPTVRRCTVADRGRGSGGRVCRVCRWWCGVGGTFWAGRLRGSLGGSPLVMVSTAAGPASAGLERLMARFAAGLRVGGAAAGGGGAFLGLAAPAVPAAVGAAVGVLAVWAACYAVALLRRGWAGWLVAGDIAVASALC